MFGEGRHANMEQLYTSHLAPFLTQTSHAFWKTRLHYFKSGLYYQGGMVRYSPPSTPLPNEDLLTRTHQLKMQVVLIVKLPYSSLKNSRDYSKSQRNDKI